MRIRRQLGTVGQLVMLMLVTTHARLAAEPVVPNETWEGIVADVELKAAGPESGFIGDEPSWKTLWTRWCPNEALPAVDFDRSLVLVGTTPGPNRVLLSPTIDARGNLRVAIAGTERGGPGFGYTLALVDREGVVSVDGNQVNPGRDTASNAASNVADQIQVQITGRLTAGIMAIGGETTGTTVSANGITWELDFVEDAQLVELAEKLDGQQAYVTGSLTRRAGVEIGERWIVRVTSLTATPPSSLEANRNPPFTIQSQREDSEFQLKTRPSATIIDVRSRVGIDRATIKRVADTWPQSVVLRLHLRGLESLTVGAGNVSVRWSVPSTAPSSRLVSLYRDGISSRLDDTSPYYSKLHMVDGTGTIPLKDGYFELTLPTELFDENPDEISVHWIDFFRG